MIVRVRAFTKDKENNYKIVFDQDFDKPYGPIIEQSFRELQFNPAVVKIVTYEYCSKYKGNLTSLSSWDRPILEFA